MSMDVLNSTGIINGSNNLKTIPISFAQDIDGSIDNAHGKTQLEEQDTVSTSGNTSAQDSEDRIIEKKFERAFGEFVSKLTDVKSVIKFINSSPTVLHEVLFHDNIENLETLFGYRTDLLQIAGLYALVNETNHTELEVWNRVYGQISRYRCTHDVADTVLVVVREVCELVRLDLERRRKSLLTCVLCSKNQASVLYLPCGHLITCSACTKARGATHCHNCGTAVKEHHVIYF